MQVISQLQTVQPKYWSGLTRDTHLGNLFMLEPQLISPLIEQLYSVDQSGDDFISFVNKYPKMYVKSYSTPYTWMLQGADEKNVPLIAAYSDASGTPVAATDKLGLGLSYFYMSFPERYFSVTSVIVGEYPNQYALRVMSDPIQSGSGWLYEVQLQTQDYNLFVPYDHLTAGSRWSEDYGSVESSLSRRGVDVKHVSPFMMQNTLSMMRMQYEVPGDMIRQGKNAPLAFAFISDDGKQHTAWIDKLGWDFAKQFRRHTARLLIYGKSNMTADGGFTTKGESGYEIRSGFGLYDQIGPSNTHYYNTLSLDYLTQVALGMCVSKIPEDSREFVLSMGEYGLYDFHMASENKASSITYLRNEDRIYKAGDNKLGIKGQYVEYISVNGIKFKVMVDPMKDNPVRNKLAHPSGGLWSSREIDIWDFGTSSGEPNIQRVALEGDEEIFRYIPGLRDPFTPGGYNNTVNPVMTASTVDGYMVMKAFIGGIRMKNPTKAARLIPSVLY